MTFGEYETLKEKRYTFHQNQVFGFIQKRLDYFFVSNTLQDFVKKTNVFASFSTDHSHQFFSHLKKEMVLFVEEDYGSLISL